MIKPMYKSPEAELMEIKFFDDFLKDDLKSGTAGQDETYNDIDGDF